MGPGVKVDPLSMLGEAKRVCDTLVSKLLHPRHNAYPKSMQLSNPSQLVTNPPPPSVYPVLSAVYQPVVQPQPTPTVTTTTTPTATATPGVITGAQSFVVPLGQPTYPQYVYGSAPGQYTTTPYYQYPAYGHPAPYYAHPPQMPPQQQPVASTSAAAPTTPAAPQPTATITTTPATGGTVIGNQGAWSDEETEKLKKLAEESKSKGTSGEIEWDWVIQEWGISRTRYVSPFTLC